MIDPQPASLNQAPTPVASYTHESADVGDSACESAQATSTIVHEGSEQQTSGADDDADAAAEDQPQQDKIEPQKKADSIVTFPKQVSNAWGVGSKPQPDATLQNTGSTNNVKKRSNTTILSGDTPSNNDSSKLKFADIMAEQQSDKVDKSPAVSGTRGVNFSHEVETEEERQMRLAIEASLKDQQSTGQGFESYATKMPPPTLKNLGGGGPVKSSGVSFSNTDVTYDAGGDMDDDMRMAIALSLQETKGGGDANAAGAGSYDFVGSTSKSNELEMETADDDRKPSALPKEDDDLKPAAADMKSDLFKGEHAVSAAASTAAVAAPMSAAASAASIPSNDESEKLAMTMHEAELAQYNASIDATAAAEAASLQLAMQLQEEEDARHNRNRESEAARLKREEMCHGGGGGSVGVRTVSRDEFNSLKSDKDYGDGRIIDRRKVEERGMGKLLSSKPGYQGDEMTGEYGEHEYDETVDYYYYANDRLQGDDVQEDYEAEDEDHIRMNSQSNPSSWKRFDNDSFIGPNNEIRTKHDTELKHRSNARKISHGSTKDASAVSDRAYNAFKRAESRQSGFKKGVAKQGHGRAENMNVGKTRGGTLDGRVLEQVSTAINAGLIESFNGVVKEGKEAMVYHADGGKGSPGKCEGPSSDGYDVAVKVFKRIAEFKTR